MNIQRKARKRKCGPWQRLVTWLVPAVIWMWGLWMAAIGLLMLWKG